MGNKIRILYDHQIFTLQKHGGISRIFFELLVHYSRQKEMTVKLPIQYSNNEYLMADKRFNADVTGYKGLAEFNKFFFGLKFRGKGRLYKLTHLDFKTFNANEDNTKLSIEEFKKGNFDIFHPTYYDPYFLDYIGNKPFVITVLDMIHEIYPEYFALEDKIRSWKKELVSRASAIITISNRTKMDLIDIYKIDPSKIHIVYPGSLEPSGEKRMENQKYAGGNH